MDAITTQMFTQVKPVSRLGKVLQFPLTRIVLAFLFVLPILILSNLFFAHVIKPAPEPTATILRYARSILTIVGLMIVYRLYVRRVEKRHAYEMTLGKSFGEFGAGSLISLGLIGLMILVMAVAGYYRIDHFNPAGALVDSLFHFGVVAFVEELLFRVILFKLVEELCGSWIALIATGLLFGFLHIVNPNATLWTSVGIVISSSVFLTCAFMLTRRIWMIWGVHLFWNLAQAGVFGMPCSGVTSDNWIAPVISGPEWVTGGAFGVEASPIFILLPLCVGVVILKKALERDRLVRPMWRR